MLQVWPALVPEWRSRLRTFVCATALSFRSGTVHYTAYARFIYCLACSSMVYLSYDNAPCDVSKDPGVYSVLRGRDFY
jgi:hypothetical protein